MKFFRDALSVVGKLNLCLDRITAVHAYCYDAINGLYVPRVEHDRRVTGLIEANNEMVEETRALRRQLIAAGMEPCV